MNCPKKIKIDVVTLHSLCFQNSGKKIFCTKSLHAMKSGLFMITVKIENHELTLVNIDIDAKAQYPRQEGFALYLVGLERCVIL